MCTLLLSEAFDGWHNFSSKFINYLKWINYSLSIVYTYKIFCLCMWVIYCIMNWEHMRIMYCVCSSVYVCIYVYIVASYCQLYARRLFSWLLLHYNLCIQNRLPDCLSPYVCTLVVLYAKGCVVVWVWWLLFF